MKDLKYQPLYIQTRQAGKFKEKIEKAYKLLEKCGLCPRLCGVNRLKGERGFCGIGKDPVISSYGPHFGEESPLVGMGGSGTIFLTGCNLGCCFCQNYHISILREGYKTTPREIAQIMIGLQQGGCHNINFVTPTHQAPFLIESIFLAIEMGLELPIVWNCGGYESTELLEILEGIVDIYMPDFKFWDEEPAKKYLQAPHYPQKARESLTVMHRQVGDLQTNRREIAYKGLLVRHLVMPENLAGTYKLVNWIAEEISINTYINIMNQYHPCFEAVSHQEINRSITRDEFRQALQWAKDAGLRLDSL